MFMFSVCMYPQTTHREEMLLFFAMPMQPSCFYSQPHLALSPGQGEH